MTGDCAVDQWRESWCRQWLDHRNEGDGACWCGLHVYESVEEELTTD